MAHTCPECAMVCHCGGDIDDIDFGEDYGCSCCLGKTDERHDDEDDYFEDSFEGVLDPENAA